MFSQREEEKHILARFGDGYGAFLDIGAYDGKTFSNTHALALKGWRGVCVEPSPSVMQSLRACYAERPDIEIFGVFVGAENKEIAFFDSSGDAVSSTNAKHIAQWQSYGVHFEEIKVQSWPVNTLLDKSTIKAFDMVNIDVEDDRLGFEILKQLNLRGLGVKCVVIETDESVNRGAVVQYLADRGFTVAYSSAENIVATRPTKICVVNYATTNAWFPFGQERLADSLRHFGFDGDILLYDETLPSCPTHQEVPYGFKPHCLSLARSMGYDMALWLDASFWARMPVKSFFDLLARSDVLVQQCDMPVGQWCSDVALNALGLSRDEAFNLPMFSGGMVGLNFASQKANAFLDEWLARSLDGKCFQGAWNNNDKSVSADERVKGHRHDMAVGSVIMNRLGIPIQGNNKYFSYLGWYEKYKTEYELADKIYFVCEGGERPLSDCITK